MTYDEAVCALTFDVEGLSPATLRQMSLRAGLETDQVVQAEEVRNCPPSDEGVEFVFVVRDDIDYFAETAVWMHGWYCLPSVEPVEPDGGEVYEEGVRDNDIPF